MGTDCALVMKESIDVHLANIASALRSNYLALFTGFLLVVAALYLSSLIASVAISTVRSYYALLPESGVSGKTTRKAKNSSVAGDHDDDNVYPDEATAAAGLASNLQDSDNSRIRAKIDMLKAKYATYNTASKEYADSHSTYEPNLMDEQILSRANDDFLPPLGAGARDGSAWSSVFTQRSFAPTPSDADVQTAGVQSTTLKPITSA